MDRLPSCCFFGRLCRCWPRISKTGALVLFSLSQGWVVPSPSGCLYYQVHKPHVREGARPWTWNGDHGPNTTSLNKFPRILTLPWVTPLSAQRTCWDVRCLSFKLWDVTILSSKISGHGGASQPSTHLPNTHTVSLRARHCFKCLISSYNNTLSGKEFITRILLIPPTGGLRVVYFLISCPNITMGSRFLSPLASLSILSILHPASRVFFLLPSLHWFPNCLQGKVLFP